MPPPRQPPHTAEFVTLRDYIDLQIDTIHKSTGTALQALDKRLDTLNEIRSTLRDQNATFITRVELDAFKERIDKEIRSLSESRAELRGKASQASVMIATVLAIISIILRLVGM